MTIRLLKPYAQRPINAIATFDASVEAGLVAAGRASEDLTGGIRYFIPRPGLPLQLKQAAFGSVQLKMEEQTTLRIPEGQVLLVTGAAGTVGSVTRVGTSDSWSVGAGSLPAIGPFAGSEQFLITCTTGSIEATAGDSALGFKSSTRRDSDFGMTSGLRLMSNNSTVSSGAGAGTGRVFDTQHPALSEYYAVAAVYANYDTTAAMHVNGAKLAPCPTHMRANVTALAWTGYLQVAGQQAFDVPVATAGVTVGSSNKIPGYMATDATFVDSTPRTDGGIFPLTRVRSHINDNVFPLALPGTLANYNALVGLRGLQYAAYSFPGVVGDITASGAAIAEYGGSFEPVALKYYYYKRTIEIACGGDSLTQGAGTLGNVMGWPMRLAMMNNPANDFVVSPCSHGVSGQKLEDSHATLLAYCAAAKPTHAAFFGWSPNNAPVGSAAAMNALWKLTVQTGEKLLEMGIRPVVLTSGPVDAYGGVDKALVLTQNARIMALPEKFIKVDVASAITLNGNINPAYSAGDGTHYNDAGYTLIASLVWDAII